MEETRKIGDYSVKYSMYIGHKDIALGENPNADKDERYMCCFVETNAIFERYSGVLVSDDFAEIAKVFGQRVADAAEEIIQENERACQEVGINEELMAESCAPVSYKDSIENKVVVINGSIEEYVSLPVSMFGKGDFYILRAKGDSMVDAGIDEDDLLVIERNCPALEGDIVVALDEDNQNTLKRYAGYDEDSGYYILEYENEEQYPGKTVKLRSFQVQGVARHVIKSL